MATLFQQKLEAFLGKAWNTDMEIQLVNQLIAKKKQMLTHQGTGAKQFIEKFTQANKDIIKLCSQEFKDEISKIPTYISEAYNGFWVDTSLRIADRFNRMIPVEHVKAIKLLAQRDYNVKIKAMDKPQEELLVFKISLIKMGQFTKDVQKINKNLVVNVTNLDGYNHNIANKINKMEAGQEKEYSYGINEGVGAIEKIKVPAGIKMDYDQNGLPCERESFWFIDVYRANSPHGVKLNVYEEYGNAQQPQYYGGTKLGWQFPAEVPNSIKAKCIEIFRKYSRDSSPVMEGKLLQNGSYYEDFVVDEKSPAFQKAIELKKDKAHVPAYNKSTGERVMAQVKFVKNNNNVESWNISDLMFEDTGFANDNDMDDQINSILEMDTADMSVPELPASATPQVMRQRLNGFNPYKNCANQVKKIFEEAFNGLDINNLFVLEADFGNEDVKLLVECDGVKKQMKINSVDLAEFCIKNGDIRNYKTNEGFDFEGYMNSRSHGMVNILFKEYFKSKMGEEKRMILEKAGDTNDYNVWKSEVATRTNNDFKMNKMDDSTVAKNGSGKIIGSWDHNKSQGIIYR